VKSALLRTLPQSVFRLVFAHARAIPLLVCSAYVVCFVPYRTLCPYAGHLTRDTARPVQDTP
jgi:hypothetical protein